MTRLEQVLTELEPMAPAWTRAIRKCETKNGLDFDKLTAPGANGMTPDRMNLSDPASCIVGEIWGWSSEYVASGDCSHDKFDYYGGRLYRAARKHDYNAFLSTLEELIKYEAEYNLQHTL